MRYYEEHWVLCWDETEQNCYFYETTSGESVWHPPQKVVRSGRHSEEWFVCFDERLNFEYYLCVNDFSVHAMEYPQEGDGSNYHDYYNPPKLAKMGLKVEHAVVMEYVAPILVEPKKPIKRTRKANKKAFEKKGPEVEELPLPPPVAGEGKLLENGNEGGTRKKKKNKKKKRKKKSKDDPYMPQSVGRSKRRKKNRF